MFQNPSQENLKSILEQAHTIAVVGLSDNPSRTSYMISKAMQQHGFRIIPVNPKVDHVLGERSYASLLDIPDKIDIVNVFRRSEYVFPIAEHAVQINAKTLWLQQGVIHEAAAEYATKHDVQVVMNLCIKVMASILLPRNK